MQHTNASMMMRTAKTNEHIFEAFEELTMLKVITSGTAYDTFIRVDRQRLYSLGYILIVICGQPAFVTLLDYSYMCRPQQYLYDIIPTTCLHSYILIQVKSIAFSNSKR